MMRPRFLPHSLFGQLVLAQSLLFGATIILLPTVMVINLHKTADDIIAERLQGDAWRIAAELARPAPSSGEQLNEVLGPFYRAGWAMRAYRVSDEAGRLLYEGGVTRDFSGSPPASLGANSFVHRGDLDLFQETKRIGGRTYRIAVAQDRSRPEVIIDDVVATFLRRTFWIVPLIFMGSTLLSLLVIRRLTSTMRHVAKDADRIGLQTLGTRLRADQLPMEARSLAAATNRALDRVELGYKRQASFVSSVAHELRTPLALVALRCDSLPAGPEKDALRRAIDQAAHVVSQLMELAVIEGRQPSMEAVELDRVARETVEASAPLVYRSGRTIEVMSNLHPAIAVQGNDGLLRIALTNLIDNAVRHTPEGTHIVVAVIHDAIFVCDNGPGIEIDDSDEAGARYRNAAQQRSDSAGLGLAIVQRIMAAMGGSMAVVPNTPGTNIRLQLRADEHVGSDRETDAMLAGLSTAFAVPAVSRT